MTQFKSTLELFKAALTTSEYSTYWEWMELPDVLKTAALYVNFYNQITLAYKKNQRPFLDEADAVEIVLQYLEKNTDIIYQNRNRYTANYIYRVAFNAIYPLTRREVDIQRYETSTSLYEYILDLDELESDDRVGCSAYRARAVSYDRYSFDTPDIKDYMDTLDKELQRLITLLLDGRKPGKKLSKRVPDLLRILKSLK